MTNGGKLLMGALGILVLWTGMRVIATETSGGTPYQGIVERNVFGLKPPAPPPDPAANLPPPPKIIFQGIINFRGIKRALFKMQMPPKPGEPAKGEQSFNLAEGQRDGDIEILEIDEKARTVKVNNFGTITTLNFDNNGVKMAGAAAPAAQPAPAGFVPPPGANPFGSAGGLKGLPPTRPMRMDSTGAAASPGGYGGPRAQNTYNALPTASTYNPAPGVVMSGGTPGTVTLPGVGSPPATTARQQNWPPETAMTPEQAAIQEAAYMLKNKTAIENGTMPSIPGSNPLLDSGNTSGQTTPPKNTTPTRPLPPGAARPYPY